MRHPGQEVVRLSAAAARTIPLSSDCQRKPPVKWHENAQRPSVRRVRPQNIIGLERNIEPLLEGGVGDFLMVNVFAGRGVRMSGKFESVDDGGQCYTLPRCENHFWKQEAEVQFWGRSIDQWSADSERKFLGG